MLNYVHNETWTQGRAVFLEISMRYANKSGDHITIHIILVMNSNGYCIHYEISSDTFCTNVHIHCHHRSSKRNQPARLNWQKYRLHDTCKLARRDGG